MGKRILIADPAGPARRNLTALLSADGHSCLQASDGLEALTFTLYERPDLVLIDPWIGGVAGPHFCHALRINSATALIPVIFLTMDDLVSALPAALDAGAVDCLQKPITAKALLPRISYYTSDPYEPEQVVMLAPEDCPASFPTKVLRTDGKTMAVAMPKCEQAQESFLAPGRVAEIQHPSAFGVNRRQIVLGGRKSGEPEELEVFLASAIYRSRRRMAFRKSVNLLVRYKPEGEFFRLATITDISGSGLRISGCNESIAVGQRLRLDFKVPSAAISVVGSVVWRSTDRSEPVSVGVQISDEGDPRWRLDLTAFLFGGDFLLSAS